MTKRVVVKSMKGKMGESWSSEMGKQLEINQPNFCKNTIEGKMVDGFTEDRHRCGWFTFKDSN